MESIIYISTKFIFPPAVDIQQRQNCCNFSAGTVIYWSIMYENEAALQMLLSKNLCKAIYN